MRVVAVEGRRDADRAVAEAFPDHPGVFAAVEEDPGACVAEVVDRRVLKAGDRSGHLLDGWEAEPPLGSIASGRAGEEVGEG